MRPKINVMERVKKLGIWKGREQGLPLQLVDAAALFSAVQQDEALHSVPRVTNDAF
jgi:hypothetical protein